MKNGDVVFYRGSRIRKCDGEYIVGGYVIKFKSLKEAKEQIDADIAEDEELDRIERYVREVLGGWM